MTFEELKTEVLHLSPEERAELSIYLRELETPEEHAQQFLEAVAALREGLTAEERQAIADAMNEEYIRPKDHFAWLDDIPFEER